LRNFKPLGYATGQFGKNHLGDKDEFLPTNHGFDEFFGNLYHLNAEEEPEDVDYPKDPEFKKHLGPRGVIHSYADGKIEDTGPLTIKRMETVDENSPLRRLISWTDSIKRESPSSATSTPRECTSGRISNPSPTGRPSLGLKRMGWSNTMAWSDNC
jgi:arylsulfatase A-like enzyme